MSQKVTSDIQIRFSDVDAMGHVNNAVYLNYFEYARMQYFDAILGTDWDWWNQGILLANNNVDYLHPLLLNDKARIDTYCSKIGNKSFVLEYNLYVTNNGNQILYTKGSSTLVCFDYEKKETILVPEIFKNKMK